MKIINQMEEAQAFLAAGKIIAYPTEAVYGLGCDPFNQQAVERLLSLKNRSVKQGLIILIADWSQLTSFIDKVPEHLLSSVKSTWPGPVTWIFPKTEKVPAWLTGEHSGIAIRMTAHPVAHALCKERPIVSTSANISGHPPAMNLAEVRAQFLQGIDGFVTGELGNRDKPSDIYDVMSGKQLR